MHLEYLRTLQTIVRLGSFSAAARALHLSQPAVSLQVKEIERHFGARVFERGHGPLRLTPEGKRVLPLVEGCLTAYEGALLAAVERSPASGLHLRVAAGVSMVEYTLPRLLEPFMRSHPCIEVVFQTVDRHGEVCTQVARRQADVGFAHAENTVLRLVLAECPLPVVEEEISLVVPAGHHWAGRAEPVDLAELPREYFIFRDGKSSITKVVCAHLGQLGFIDRIQVRMELASNEAVKATVRAGLGIAFLPVPVVEAELRAGTLVRVPVTGLNMRRRWSVVYRKGEESSEALLALLQFCHGQQVGESLARHAH